MAVAERHSEDDVPALPTPGPCCLFARNNQSTGALPVRAHCIPRSKVLFLSEKQSIPNLRQAIVIHRSPPPTGHRFGSDFLSKVLFLSEKQSIPNLRQAIVNLSSTYWPVDNAFRSKVLFLSEKQSIPNLRQPPSNCYPPGTGSTVISAARCYGMFLSEKQSIPSLRRAVLQGLIEQKRTTNKSLRRAVFIHRGPGHRRFVGVRQ